jgi:hypothetical protein
MAHIHKSEELNVAKVAKVAKPPNLMVSIVYSGTTPVKTLKLQKLQIDLTHWYHCATLLAPYRETSVKCSDTPENSC